MKSERPKEYDDLSYNRGGTIDAGSELLGRNGVCEGMVRQDEGGEGLEFGECRQALIMAMFWPQKLPVDHLRRCL